MLSCMSRSGVVAIVMVAAVVASAAAEGSTARRVIVSSNGLYAYALDQNAPARKHEPRLPLCKGKRLRARLPAPARRVVVNLFRTVGDAWDGLALTRVSRDDRRQLWVFSLGKRRLAVPYNEIHVFVDGGRARGTYLVGAVVARCN